MRTKAKCHPTRVAHSGDKCHSCYQHARRTKAREQHLANTYGITIKQYNIILQYQGGVCAICRNTPKTRRLAVDHDHKTGKPRGLLCHRCNRALGWMRDNPEFALSMRNYLISPPFKRWLEQWYHSVNTEPMSWWQSVEASMDPEQDNIPRDVSYQKETTLVRIPKAVEEVCGKVGKLAQKRLPNIKFETT